MSALARRLLGAALLAAVWVPLHRILSAEETGLAGRVTRRIAEDVWSLSLWGAVASLGAAAGLALLSAWDPAAWGRRIGARLLRVSASRFALACAALAFVAAAGAAVALFGASPTSVDEMVQLLHARALLQGRLTLPLPADPAAWSVQNSLLVDGGWVSVYPPMHTLALAAGLAIGMPWLIGPVAAAVMVGASASAAVRLLPDTPLVARAAGLLVALSPFLAFLGGTHLSHATAGAFVALTLLFALRARDGSWRWALAAGAAAGGAVCARPWTGLALSTAVLASTWIPASRGSGTPLRWLGHRSGGLVLGAAPFAALLLTWNQQLFGHPLRLGYVSAFGPAHGLGFHTDPWGNAYGAAEALAYTGSDLSQLGLALLESPLSALGVVGFGLLLLRRLPRGSGVLLAWAGAAVGANAVYWHHGIHLGPRLLLESAPAWLALWALSVAGLTSRDAPLPPRGRRAAAWAVALSLVAGAALLPGRIAAYRPDPATLAAARIPGPPSEPAILFVHGSWSSRVAARLAATGMRRDSLETALRRNDICAVDRYARWRRDRDGPEPRLDLEPLPGAAPHLESLEISPGNRVQVDPRARPDSGCAREARADRVGTVELEPLLWQAPPLRGTALVVARDLGPAANEAVRAAFPGYRSWAVVDGGRRGGTILEYDEGMKLLWSPDELSGGEG